MRNPRKKESSESSPPDRDDGAVRTVTMNDDIASLPIVTLNRGDVVSEPSTRVRLSMRTWYPAEDSEPVVSPKCVELMPPPALQLPA
mmetsp:Transcript_32946/g.40458  ORF Transcript_32946/g.40458 Transcript_32946/m.40458 type:complete len:87 (-) Transcript_32946:169-429(-)